MQTSHVLPALIAKFVQAQKNNDPNVIIWGTGAPRREFLYVDDLADGCIFLMRNYAGNEIVNVGTGQDVTIIELAQTIKKIIGYQGSLKFDATKPDGTPRKLLNVDRMASLGWRAQTSFEDGIGKTIVWYLDREK